MLHTPIAVHALTESAVRKSDIIKNELAVLLAQNTAVMTPEQYTVWKKKVDDGLAYLKKTFPLITQNYEQTVELKAETYRVAHNLAQELSNNNTIDITKESLSTATSMQMEAKENKELVAFNNQLAKITAFPDQIKKELAQFKVTIDALPLFYANLQEVDTVEDLFVELLAAGLITPEIKKKFYEQKETIIQSISNAIAQVTHAVLLFSLNDASGLKAQVAWLGKVAELDTFATFSSGPWAEMDNYIALFLSLNDLLITGVWQEDDVLIKALPNVEKATVTSIKTTLNALVNNTQKNGLPAGLYDRLVFHVKKILDTIARILEDASLTSTDYDFIHAKCDTLTDYVACMLECETVLLKHYNKKEIELESVDLHGAESLITLLNSIKKRINDHIQAGDTRKQSELDNLLLTFEAASLAIHKVISSFVNPLQDTIPNIGALYDQVQKTYDKYLNLVESKKIGTSQQDIFLKEYNSTLKDLDTQTVQFINKILAYIMQKENLPEINNWLKATVASYAKGVKKMNTLVADDATKCKLYGDLIKVLTDLFIKGVGLKGQAISFKDIVKRGLVDAKIMNECESGINMLFNTAKDGNGVVKGLVSRAIEAIDSLLLLAQEYMSSLDVLLVKAYQAQIAPLVQLLASLFAMENVLVEPELQKFVKKQVPNPFSSSDILVEAQALINTADAQRFALALNSSSANSVQTVPSFAQDNLLLLESIENDVVSKLAALKLPDSIPSFAKEYNHLREAELLYQDMKKDFSIKEKDEYKNKSVHAAQSIDIAVVQVAFKALEYIMQKGGLLEKQLAYIANLYINFTKGQKGLLAIANTQEFKTILAQAQSIKSICDAALLPLKNIHPITLQFDMVKKSSAQLIALLNTIYDSSLDIKKNNAPVGLLNKLVATWLKFFEEWQKSVQKLTVAQVQKEQLQLKPALDLLICYKDIAMILQTIATTMPIVHPDMPVTFVDAVQKIVDPAQAQSLVISSIDTSTMQAKQEAQNNKPLESAPVTVDTVSTVEQPKEKKQNSAKIDVKKDSPAQVALAYFAKVKADFIQNVAKIDFAKLVIPSIQGLFTSIEKGKDAFEFDSALATVSSDENTQVEKAYQELLLFGFQQAFSIGKTVLEKSNAELKSIIKDLAKVLKTYADDPKKVAGIKKDVALKNSITRIQAINSLWTLSLYQLTELKNRSVEGTINTLDAFLQQLNLLIDNTVKDNAYVGLLNELIDQWQSLFNVLLGHMKTLPVDKVILFQQEILFLQDVCTVIDKSIAKINAIIDGKRIIVKKGTVAAAFADVLQKITKKENAAQYAKGSTLQADSDVQKALISLSDAMSKKK
ncbi:hypothetical protein EKK58_02465 [Candidatus Dependentiae bacterium]|nr:MAG: hypothetical protein EKK58_02465 [Candidatus Dependentiae bacterium]